ncbi:hypothetical protein [Hydrogenivirga sp. 128-5-R1-1]|uniref:hypothetical protein n=1 Tax=Hydrogenivirga sp. 128-5-R1-1 TaxID=392423 RepID=UPI00015F3327|nr:hypothetical protein [Hydrogenivirga sp. 128-5-R1-1]EDP74861.1 hypothetical protein HG1285_13372 [Hydrogenivirga sp. 128-5-R1-1]
MVRFLILGIIGLTFTILFILKAKIPGHPFRLESSPRNNVIVQLKINPKAQVLEESTGVQGKSHKKGSTELYSIKIRIEGKREVVKKLIDKGARFVIYDPWNKRVVGELNSRLSIVAPNVSGSIAGYRVFIPWLEHEVRNIKDCLSCTTYFIMPTHLEVKMRRLVKQFLASERTETVTAFLSLTTLKGKLYVRLDKYTDSTGHSRWVKTYIPLE